MSNILQMAERYNSLVIGNEEFKIYLKFIDNRFVLFDKRIDCIIDTDVDITNTSIGSEDFILQMLHLFKHDLDTLNTILTNDHLYSTLCSFIRKCNKKWYINEHDVTYKYSNNIKIRVFFNRHKFNKTSVQFILSNYFNYFENQYLLNIKDNYINKISYIHNVKPSLINTLLSVKKEFIFDIDDVTQIALIKYLKAYTKELYN